MENNYELTQEVTLPSRGLLNAELPEGKVVQRIMMLTDHMKISGSSSSKSLPMRYLELVTVEPENFSLDNLTIPDTLFLLFKMRSFSYGDNYKYKARCPVCGAMINVSVDLSKLQVIELDDDYEKKLEITLANGDIVRTRFLRNYDLDDINKEIARILKNAPEANESGHRYLLRLTKMIKSVKKKASLETLDNPVDIRRYIETLRDSEANMIADSVENVAYGIVPEAEVFCPSCRETVDVGVSMSPDFFRPRS